MIGRLIAHKDDLLGCLNDYNAINVALQQLPCFHALQSTKKYPKRTRFEFPLSLRRSRAFMALGNV